MGVGKGAAGLRERLFSRPPTVREYCHERIVGGGKGALMVKDWKGIWCKQCWSRRFSSEVANRFEQ